MVRFSQTIDSYQYIIEVGSCPHRIIVGLWAYRRMTKHILLI